MTAATARVVVVCQGHRCRALLAAQAPGGMALLRSAVADSDHGVLLSADCLSPCARGPVVGLASGHAAGETLSVQIHALLGPVGPQEAEELGQAVRSAPRWPALPGMLGV